MQPDDHNSENRPLTRLIQHGTELIPEYVWAVIKDEDTINLKDKLDKIIQQIPEGKQRQKLISKLRKALNREKADLQDKIAPYDRHLSHLRSAVDVAERIEKWLHGDLKLQKPIGTMIHSFREALADGAIYDLPSRDAAIPPRDAAAWDEMAASASVFIVQHNWAAAFKNAKDYIGGEIRLPDDSCAFEFRINDRHVIAFGTDVDGILYLQYAVQIKKGWLVLPVSTGQIDHFDHFQKMTSEQVRAITVALDAEIATTEIIRAPHKLNHARERNGKLPIMSYHIVNLAHRSRAIPLAPSDHEPAYHVRLHFRRGHWRHFENHKTWIKWMLVGDPELGFVDKEYRL